MSVSAHLADPARALSLGLGKPLRRPDGSIERFARPGSTPVFARCLWKFLAESSGAPPVVAFSGDPDFDTVAGYREIGGWVEDGDIPYTDYLAEEPVETIHYYATLRTGHPRSDPSRLVRRRGTGDGAADEAFTHNLRWEPTGAVGLDDVENMEVSEDEAVDLVLAELTRRRSI